MLNPSFSASRVVLIVSSLWYRKYRYAVILLGRGWLNYSLTFTHIDILCSTNEILFTRQRRTASLMPTSFFMQVLPDLISPVMSLEMAAADGWSSIS